MLFIGRVTADEIVAEAARQHVAIDADDFRIIASDRAKVPHWLGAVDVATSFIMPTWSSLGVSPTKVGEYLASGVPVIANRGIGDVGEIIAETQGGHLMNEFSDEDLEAAAKAFFGLLGRDRNQLSGTTRKRLDLPLAIAAYNHIYRDPETAVDLGMPR